MNITELTIKAEQICVFKTFDSWVNYASNWIGGYNPRYNVIVCIDKNGYLCDIGKQFMFARDNKLFPVTAYRLIKNTENL
ncbi:MAG: hypothetical protein LBN95_03885 [Prevotellaceae bacterium]|jgi:hypothetical protein|nr:hypothetical protein [Prevotellaceae bacterium]